MNKGVKSHVTCHLTNRRLQMTDKKFDLQKQDFVLSSYGMCLSF